MIAQMLLNTGILQFGLFVDNNTTSAYRIRLEMLSAYPEVMQQVIYRGIQTIATSRPFDRLVSHPDCIPLASAVSLNTGISLVYSRGQAEAPVHDLVGAYDVGHPSCLLVNTITPATAAFITNCQRVGLEIHTILEVVAKGEKLEGFDQRHIFTLTALVHELQLQQVITPELAAAIVQT